jgi:hypothetical protein
MHTKMASRLELVGNFSLSFFFSYLRILYYLGSISVLLRGRGAVSWAATTKTGIYIIFLLFILLITVTGTTIATSST